MTISPRLAAALGGITGLVVAVPAWVVSHPPTLPPSALKRVSQVLPPRRVVPQAELPPVEPVTFVQLAPDDARAFNASVPFSTAPNPAARPFRYAGSDDDRARATDCLAAAVLYEAGDDATGERAVAQVVLNRLRHPAFPKTVCGVVFEGSERSTGCQFTFSCDGALTRWKPSEAGWTRARDVAAQALAGFVYKPVGYATHYHTDWVVPYWQSSLDKIAKVGTHLFFRWAGWWGTPPAFDRSPLTGEPAIAALATLSPTHGLAAALVEADGTTAAATLAAEGATPTTPRPAPDDANAFLVLLDPRLPSDSYRTMAIAACGERVNCKLLGWADPKAMATSAAVTPEQMEAMDFSYLRDRSFNFERVLWNCATFKRDNPRECMRRLPARPAAAPVAAPTPKAPEPLTGVRRQADAPVPAATATPAAKPAPPVRPPETSPAARP